MNELPKGWARTALAQLVPPDAPIIYGILQPGPETAGGIAYVRPTEIVNDVINLSALRRTTSEIATRYRRSTLKVDDIILSIVGTIGKVAIVPSELEGGNITQSSCRVRPDNAVVVRDMITHFLRSPLARAQFEELRLGTAVARLNLEDVREVAVPLPPLAEQRRVVAKIDSLSTKSRRARDHLDHIPRLVEKYKQAILAAAFRGDLTKEWRDSHLTATWSQEDRASLRKQREKYLQERRGSRLQFASESQGSVPIPTSWFAAHFADVGELQVGYAYKSKWYSKQGIRLLRGANVAPGKIIWEDEVRLPSKLADDFAEYALNDGDIVIAMDRPIISTGLKVARIEAEDVGCLLVQRVARYVPSSFVDRSFVWFVINSGHFISHAVKQATGSDLPHISSNDILTTPMPLPPRSEQREIVKRLESSFAWIDRLALEATTARKLIDRLDQTVLAKAFGGGLVPQDPNDEPASVLLERIRSRRVQVDAKQKASLARGKRRN